MNNSLAVLLLYFSIFGCLSFVYSRNAIHMFQQQKYELRRYTKWLFNKNILHYSPVFIYCFIQIVLFVLDKFVFDHNIICSLISLVVTIVFSINVIDKETKKQYIKDLVITKRVVRQIIVYVIILFFCINRLLQYDNVFILGIAVIFGPYFLIYPMAIITYPIESLIKRHYINQAKLILYSMNDLIKIGITGSYGKTSTKNIINDVISKDFFTLITPSSFNTPMGITKTIKEQLKPIHQVFLCEMGADKLEEISDLMEFVKPKFGIVTSIGPQHLATFKKMENIVYEKMREIELLPKDGVGFINVDNEYINNYHIKNKCKIVRVGIKNTDADYVAKNIKCSNKGTSFTVKIKNRNYKFTTCLLGEHNVTNVLFAIAVAIELGIPVKNIAKNVKDIKQVEHRLEVKKINGFTIIDDAFNSNPVGSKMAVDVLKMMKGKRIIVTPGMIDLGDKQDDINYLFGKYLYKKADYVYLIGEKQTKQIYKGISDSGFDMKNVFVFANVKDALNTIFSTYSIKDTILLENDLPDAFNI